jgi:hypothetical protein
LGRSDGRDGQQRHPAAAADFTFKPNFALF